MYYFNRLFIFSLLTYSIGLYGQVFDFTGLDSNYCSDAGVVTLTGSASPQGTFTGVGITDNGNGTAFFDPSMAGTGGAINYSLGAWQSVVAGGNHSLGIQSDGSLWAWGDNFFGQLGDGSTVDSTIPVQVGSATNWQSVVGGFYHSLGIQSDGSLWAWGRNIFGQLGDGSTVSSTIPVQVGSATNWQSVAAGFYYSLGIQSDGSLWAWGYNLNGQLGDGSNTNSTIPVQVGASQFYEETVLVSVCNSSIDISISDPCSCFNPLNVLDVAGEVILFHETVSITAASGQTWNLTGLNSGGVFDVNGIALVLPAALTETPAGSGTYEIVFYHSPAVGYNATFSNGTAADEQTIGNSCTTCLSVASIPTMSQWGLLILGLLFLTFSSLFSMQSSGVLGFKFANTEASTMVQFINVRNLPFNKSLYLQILLFVLLCFVLLFTSAIQHFGYELTSADIPCSLIFSSILAYFISLFFVVKEA